MRRTATFVHIGGSTALLRLAGTTVLLDPTFDDPGEYPIGARSLRKLTAPALRIEDLPPIDLVLLSHDQHPDNLDRRGREVLAGAGRVLSTADAAARIDRVEALATWSSVDVDALTVTAVPARHGPEGCEAVTGAVTGFVVRGDGLPTIYVSGDNASVDLVAQIVDRTGDVDVAVLFAGAARTPLLDGQPLTLTAVDAVVAAGLLAPAVVLPVHTEGWAHFSEGPGVLADAFTAAGLAGHRSVVPHGTELDLWAEVDERR